MEYFLSSQHWMDAFTPPLEKHLRMLAIKVRSLLEAEGSGPAEPSRLAIAASNNNIHRERSGSPNLRLSGKRPYVVAAITVLVIITALFVWTTRHDSGSLPPISTPNASPIFRPSASISSPPAPDAVPTTDISTLSSVAPAAAPAIPASAPSLPSFQPGTLPSDSRLAKAGDLWTNSLGMKFAFIPAGSFAMGNRLDTGATPHPVTITKPFLLAIFDVTRGDFTRFVSATGYVTTAEAEGYSIDFRNGTIVLIPNRSWKNAGFQQTDRDPVVHITHSDALAFCKWLASQDHRNYKLPTEAQWEYACRANSQTYFFWGDDPDDGTRFMNCADLTLKDKSLYLDVNFAQYHDGFAFTSPVGSFQPNPWGLYDMSGNVTQLCAHYWSPDLPTTPQIDPTGPAQPDADTHYINRGGSWLNQPLGCGSSSRYYASSRYRMSDLGMRLELDLP